MVNDNMMQFISYIVYSSLILTALYLGYKWLLSRETFHRFNRAFLLGSYVVSFGALPTLFIINGQSVAALSAEGLAATAERVSASSVVNEAFVLPEWAAATVTAVYLAGVAAMLLAVIVSIRRINAVCKQSRVVDCDGCKVYVTASQRVAPFSWGGRVIVNEQDFAENRDTVLVHELRHKRSRHWIDLLAAQAVITLCWFNPAAWLMRRELQAVHEYEADRAVAQAGADMHAYQMLLLSRATGVRLAPMASFLSHSSLNKRIDMMLRPSSPLRSRWRAAVALPLIAAVVSLVNFDSLVLALTPHDAPIAYYVNGRRVSYDDLKSIDPQTVESIAVMKSERKTIIRLKP